MIVHHDHSHDHSQDHQNQNQQRTKLYTIYLLSSSIAGFIVSAITTPLDRIKTLFQTQQKSTSTMSPTISSVDTVNTTTSIATSPHNNKIYYKNW